MSDRLLAGFAETHRLRLTRDAYGRPVVSGRGQSLIAEHGNGRLSILLMGTSARWWHRRRDALVSAGARLEQDGDTEGSLSFDPADEVVVAVAIKVAGCKRRRIASPAQLAHLATLAPHRFHSGARGTFQPLEPTIAPLLGTLPTQRGPAS
jgi:hypothetical protein